MNESTNKDKDRELRPGDLSRVSAEDAAQGFRRIGEILAEAGKDRPRHPVTRGIE